MIAFDADALAARPLYFSYGLVERTGPLTRAALTGSRGDNDRGSGFRQANRASFANAATSAGHQRNAAFQSAVLRHRLVLSLCRLSFERTSMHTRNSLGVQID